MNTVGKTDIAEWNQLVSHICVTVIEKGSITKNMVNEIKALLEYINSCLRDEEKMSYGELLELFKQCKGMIDDTITGSVISEDEKVVRACSCVRSYFNMVFGEPEKKKVQIYYDKPASLSANISITIPKEVADTYNSKLDEIKKREDVNKYREFTRIGAFSTYILAVAKGLIDFKKCGEQIYLIAKDGCLGSEHELDSLSQ